MGLPCGAFIQEMEQSYSIGAGHCASLFVASLHTCTSIIFVSHAPVRQAFLWQLSDNLGAVRLALLSELLWLLYLVKPVLVVLNLALLETLESREELLAHRARFLLRVCVCELVTL